jgi:Zn-dependent M32 family carboxypeptidase
MSVNYTQEDVDLMVEEYTKEPNRETVEKLAEQLNKSIKSIIGKLSREGVYKKTVYKTKTGDTPITKKELVQELADYLELDYDRISGLEKSPKADITALVVTLREGVHNAQESWERPEGHSGLFIEFKEAV